MDESDPDDQSLSTASDEHRTELWREATVDIDRGGHTGPALPARA